VFHEAEDIFDAFNFADTKTFGKAFVNHLRESNPVPTIWITNTIRSTPRTGAASTTALAFATPPFEVRRNLIRNVFAGLALAPDVELRLAAEEAITPGQLARAARAVPIADVHPEHMPHL